MPKNRRCISGEFSEKWPTEYLLSYCRRSERDRACTVNVCLATGICSKWGSCGLKVGSNFRYFSTALKNLGATGKVFVWVPIWWPKTYPYLTPKLLEGWIRNYWFPHYQKQLLACNYLRKYFCSKIGIRQNYLRHMVVWLRLCPAIYEWDWNFQKCCFCLT